MIDVGFVDGVDGSFYLFMIVFELEVVFYYCYKYLWNGVLNIGDRVLVVDIGGGIVDFVM